MADPTLSTSPSPAAPPQAAAGLPDVNDLFPDKPLPEVETLFPDKPAPSTPRPLHGASPIADMIFGNAAVAPQARVLDAFGQGAKDNWGAPPPSDETRDFMKLSGAWKDYETSRNSFAKVASQVLLWPHVHPFTNAASPEQQEQARRFLETTWEAAKEGFGEKPPGITPADIERFPILRYLGPRAKALLAGAESAIRAPGMVIGGAAGEIAALADQAGLAGGAPGRLAQDINIMLQGAMLEAPGPHQIEAARYLKIIGPGGEAAWKGTAQTADVPEVDRALMAIKQLQAEREAQEKAGITPQEGAPIPPAPAPVTPAVADIHSVARQLDFPLFGEYDALKERQATFRNWANDLAAEPALTPEKAATRQEIEANLAGIDKRLAELAPEVAKTYKDAERTIAPTLFHVKQEPGAVGAVDTTHDVRSGAVASKDTPGVTYIDPRIPEFSPILKDKDGNPANLHKYLTIHEQDERAAMVAGMPYDAAHTNRATPAERAAVEADGVSWKAYTEEIDGYLAKIEHETVKNPPPDPHVDPNAAVDHHKSVSKAEIPSAAGAGTLESARAPAGGAAGTPVLPGAPAAPQLPQGQSIATPAMFTTIADAEERKLVAIGIPAEQAQAAAAINAQRYADRALRFEGKKGTAAELYAADPLRYRGEGTRYRDLAADRGTGARAPGAEARARGGRRTLKPEAERSLFEQLAALGGLKPTPELRQILGKNPMIGGGFGPLLRKSGMDLDHAVEALKESGHMFDRADIEGTEAKVGHVELLDLIDKEARGEKQFIHGFEPAQAIDVDEELHRMMGKLETHLAAAGIDPASVSEKIKDRAVEIMDREGVTDPGVAYERAVMEEPEFAQAARRPVEPGLFAEREAEGQQVLPGGERISDAELAQRRADQALKPKAEQKPMDIGLFGDAAKQRELFQARQVPWSYSAVARAVESARQEKASPQQWLATLKNTPGVKSEEMDWLGLPDWLKEQKGSVTKQEIADYVRANAIEVREVEHRQTGPSGWNTQGSTKFETYRLPGGENYRELLLTLPAGPSEAQRFRDALAEKYEPRGGNFVDHATQEERDELYRLMERPREDQFKSSHWDEPNVLAHVRFDDRVIDGKKTLHLAEIQSDWHQKGRKQGYAGEGRSVAEIDRDVDDTRTELLHREPSINANSPGDWHDAWLKHPDLNRRHGELMRERDRATHGGVPDAPFKTTWPELALKRMIRYAAENGYDRLSWDSGDTNAERYDLSKQIQSVRWNETTGDFQAKDHSGEVVVRRKATAEELPDLIGKDVAQKLLDQKPTEIKMLPHVYKEYLTVEQTEHQYIVRNVDGRQVDIGKGTVQSEAEAREYAERYFNNKAAEINRNRELAGQKIGIHRELSGLDLKVGGEGMKGFYDKILPAAGSKLGKKFGAKVGEARVPTFDQRDIDVPFVVRDRAGQIVERGIHDESYAQHLVESEYPGGSYAFDETVGMEGTAPVHTLDITPELREAATSQGFPLFQTKRGKIRFLNDGTSIITYFRDANASTLLHEPAHKWLEELMDDARDPDAPPDLKADAKTVLDWFKVDKAEDIRERHHESFARGFEIFMMEGRAPSQAMAKVFAKFRDWLLEIYKTIDNLIKEARETGAGKEFVGISDEMRGVYRRLLASREHEAIITPERPTAQGFADIHEAEAERLPPQEVYPAMVTAQSERDRIAATHAPEEEENRLADTGRKPAGEGAPGGPPGGAQSDRDGNAPGPVGGEAGVAAQPGALGAGGGEGEGEGASASKVARSEVPTDPNVRFGPSDSGATDKAGNIRLDKLNGPDDFDIAIREAAERTGGFMAERRHVITDGQALDLADAMGMDPAFLDLKKIGDAFNQQEIIVAKRLLIQSATDVRDLMKQAATGDEHDLMALAAAIARHEMIQGKVAQATAEWGRAGRALNLIIGGQKEAADLSRFLQENTGRTLFQIKEMAQYGQHLPTPSNVSRLIADTAGGKIKRAVIFYYVNALISGPITHMRYAVGNALNAVFTPLVEIPYSAASGAIREALGYDTAGKRVYLGEAGAQLYGLLKGSVDGLRAGVDAWHSGQTINLPGQRAPTVQFSEHNINPIPGAIGAAIGLPVKGVAAIHSFFAALRYEQNIQGLAYRQAMGEAAADMPSRIAQLTAHPTDAMMASASRDALKELYMAPTDYHSKWAGLVRFTNNNLLAKIIVPFMKIGSQITRNAIIERTPIGIFDKEFRANLGRGGADFDIQMGKVAAGMGLMGASVLMMAEGLMTSDGPTDPRQRQVWLLNHKPNTIQIGGLSIPYAHLGSLGMLMGFAANMYETAAGWGEEDGDKLAVAFMQGITRSILNETWMRGAKDMLDAVFHPEEFGGQYIRNFVTNWIPYSVGLGQVARVVDPYQREVRTIFDSARAKIPFVSEGLFPRRDMFGEPIPTAGPLPSYANDPVVKAMDAIHLSVGRLARKIRGVPLTDQQYHDYARVAGKMAKMALNRLVAVPGFQQMPDALKAIEMHKEITAAHERAANMIMMQSASGPESIIRKAIEVKRAPLQGKATAVH